MHSYSNPLSMFSKFSEYIYLLKFLLLKIVVKCVFMNNRQEFTCVLSSSSNYNMHLVTRKIILVN